MVEVLVNPKKQKWAQGEIVKDHGDGTYDIQALLEVEWRLTILQVCCRDTTNIIVAVVDDDLLV